MTDERPSLDHLAYGGQSAASQPGGSAAWPFGAVAIGYLVFVIYGSLVPFDARPVAADEAWREYLRMLSAPLNMSSRSDWGANVMLFVPLAFFVLAALLRRRGAAAVLVSLVLVPVLGLLSAAIEYIQIYLPYRSSSINDIVAETIGACIGTAVWWWRGPEVRRWVDSWRGQRRDAGIASLILPAYLCVVVLYALVPLDLIISPVELYHKWSEGRVIVLPFGKLFPNWQERIYGLGTDVLIWAIAGGLWTVARPRRPLQMAWRVMLLAGALELAQLFVMSRTTDSTALVVGWLGGLAGALAAQRFVAPVDGARDRSATAERWLMPVLIGLAAAAAWGGVMLAVFWYPFDFIRDISTIRQRLECFSTLPLYSLFITSELHAATAIMRKVLFFAPLGAALGYAALGVRPYVGALPIGLAVVLLSAGAAMLVELGQAALPSHTCDSTDVVIEAAGALLGYWVFNRLWPGRRYARVRPPRSPLPR